MRKLARVLTASLLTALSLTGLTGRAAATDGRPVVSVIQISGLLDRVQADFLAHAITEAAAAHDAALVVQLDSNRSVLGSRLARVVHEIRGARIPVAIWVGPARTASVGGEVIKLLAAADVVAVAPGAHLEGERPKSVQGERSPTLGDFLVSLDGKAGIELPSKVVKNGTRREPQFDVRFAKPSLTARTVHGVTSPGPAYALLIFGLLLAILEFATAGIGLAAATAAILLVLGALGLGGLPVNGAAVGALIFASFGFAVDVQAGAPRAWTAIGTGAMVFGTFSLYREGMHVPIVWIVGVIGLTAALLFTGLPSLIRARFSSPTIGREGFIGETGFAVGALEPDGIVNIRGATWRARTNRATPVEDGVAVRVIGIDGLVLDVEPQEGAAKDYRNH